MNKKIVITGATKGIGRALAEKFAVHGWDLALCARTERDLQVLKAEIANPASKILTMKCDASVKSDVLAFAEVVNKEFGAVDILVNNAGIFIPGQVINEEDGVLEKIIETNLYSAYYLSRALLPAMIKRKTGHIFTMGSVASIQADRKSTRLNSSHVALSRMPS